jgi:hypothetical protein
MINFLRQQSSLPSNPSDASSGSVFVLFYTFCLTKSVKIMKKSMLITCLIIWVRVLFAQQIYQELLLPAGGAFYSVEGSLNWAIGNFVDDMDLLVSMDVATDLNDPPSNDADSCIKVFPTVTAGIINVILPAKLEDGVYMRIYSVYGTQVDLLWLSFKEGVVQLQHLCPGIYHLSFVDSSGYVLDTFKIIKINSHE